MVKYTATQILDYAQSLADLQNSSFITWGDKWRLLNAAYRKVYADMIQFGDLNYIKELRLLTGGGASAAYELPEDFYQLAIVCDQNGNEIPRRRIAANTSDWGYEIKNNTIQLYNCRSNIVIKYYPIPDTITYKAKATSTITISSTPISGFGENVICSNGTLFNVAQQKAVKTLSGTWTRALLGKDYVWNITAGSVYSIASGSAVDTGSNLMLREDGDFSSITDGINGWGWCNNDLTSRFVCDGEYIYYNGEKIWEGSTYQGRYIYWNGRNVLVTDSVILYEDGSYETTDVRHVSVLLKTDTETGYGYVQSLGGTSYCVVGWTPDTIIDYPNNILFDLTAFALAIQYRVKQSADSSQLQNEYLKLADSYWKSISNDDANYTTIRNVDNRYLSFGIY